MLQLLQTPTTLERHGGRLWDNNATLLALHGGWLRTGHCIAAGRRRWERGEVDCANRTRLVAVDGGPLHRVWTSEVSGFVFGASGLDFAVQELRV